MYNLTRLVDVPEADRGRVADDLRRLAESTGAARHLLTHTDAGSRNGGDLLLHLRFGTAAERDAAATDIDAALADSAITRVNGVDYCGSPTLLDECPRGSVYRALLLRVADGTDPDTVARFEADLGRLPGYVSTISAWQLSTPEHTVGNAWTHVFEQEFSDADGIMGAYLMHPIHWAVVDQWFDPECPQFIVRDRVCHSFGTDPAGVLR